MFLHIGMIEQMIILLHLDMQGGIDESCHDSVCHRIGRGIRGCIPEGR